MNKLLLILIIACTVSTYSLSAQKETRDVGDFDEVSLGLSVDVILKQGDKNELVLEGDSDDLERIETRVSGGELRIRNKDKSWGWSNNSFRGVKIYITIKDVRALSVSGSGSMTTDGKITGRDIDLKVSGSGDLEAEFEVEELYTKISGSGDIYLKGKADYMDAGISGSGGFSANDFEVEDCDIRITGSGSARIHVNKELKARITGSGKVLYKGDPERVDANSTGSGTVRKI
ncbi:MAG: head GIN domain-containing protein [Bacteroidota bacterium]